MIDGHSTPSPYQRSAEDFWVRFDGGSGGSIHVKRPPSSAINRSEEEFYREVPGDKGAIATNKPESLFRVSRKRCNACLEEM